MFRRVCDHRGMTAGVGSDRPAGGRSAPAVLVALLVVVAVGAALLWVRQPVELARDVPISGPWSDTPDPATPTTMPLLVRCPGLGSDEPATWRYPSTGQQAVWNITHPTVTPESYCGDGDAGRWGVGLAIVLLGVGVAILVVARGRIGARRRQLVASDRAPEGS